MRAAEHDAVGARLQKRLDARADKAFDARVLGPPQALDGPAAKTLHLGHELVRDRGNHRHVLREPCLRLVVEPSIERAGRRQHAYDAGLRPKRGRLDGGLNPDNVAEAVRTVRPYAVDANSALRPLGELDPKKTTQEELGLYMAGAKRDEVSL